MLLLFIPFILPILAQLVRLVFAMDEDMQLPPCIDDSCDYLTDCDIVFEAERAERIGRRACTSIFPKYCYINRVNQCTSFGVGNFACKRTCTPFCTNKCTEKKLKCTSRQDCSLLFQCKDSYCSPTSVECYDNEGCNIFSKCADLICKFDFKSGYTIGLIVGIDIAVVAILCCVIPRLYRVFNGDRKSSGPRRYNMIQ